MLIPIGGILLWDDVKDSKKSGVSSNSVKPGVQAFLSVIDGKYDTLLTGHQMAIKKTDIEDHQFHLRRAKKLPIMP